MKKYIIKESQLKSVVDSITGGKADNMSVEDIAKYHDLPVEIIQKQLEIGISVEMEHVNDKEQAKEIALDHIYEFPNYYSRLENAGLVD